MKVEIIPCLSDNFSYLIHDKESDKVSIVDPAEYRACDNIIKKYNLDSSVINEEELFNKKIFKRSKGSLKLLNIGEPNKSTNLEI